MATQLGKLGVWAFIDNMTATEAVQFAQRLEQWGYSALWIPEAVGRDPFSIISFMAAHTEKLIFATGIANIYARDPMAMSTSSASWNWTTGSFADAPMTGRETWFVCGGSAGAALYKFRQPGIYAYVNHNLIEAVMLGATAHVVVDGEWNDDLMMQVAKAEPIT